MHHGSSYSTYFGPFKQVCETHWHSMPLMGLQPLNQQASQTRLPFRGKLSITNKAVGRIRKLYNVITTAQNKICLNKIQSYK